MSLERHSQQYRLTDPYTAKLRRTGHVKNSEYTTYLMVARITR